MPDQNYFIRSGTDQSGPFSGQQIKLFAAQGRLKPTDFIRQDVSDKWHQAGRVPDLFPTMTLPPSEPPPLPVTMPPLPVTMPTIPQPAAPVTSSNLLRNLLIAAGVLGLLLIAVITVALLNKGQAVMSREEFRNEVMGKTTTEVEAVIGKPAKQTEAFGAFIWFYHGRSLDPVTGKPDLDTTVQFHNDRADHISFEGAAGSASVSAADQPAPQAATTRSNSPISDNDFRRLVVGKTQAEVIAAIGDLDNDNKQHGPNGDIWIYEIVGTGQVRPDNAKHYAYVCFSKANDKVSLVDFAYPITAGDDLLDFNDHPDRYKGKNLIALITYQGPYGELDPEAGNLQLRFATFAGSAWVEIQVQTPPGLKAPRIHTSDRVILGFKCTNGSTSSGNIVNTIARPSGN